MALIDRPPARPDAAGVAPIEAGAPRGFRPTSRRRARLAGGVAIAAIGIVGNLLVYSSLDHSSQVVQAVSTIRQGERIDASDLRVVDARLDASVPAVPADQLGALVGQYARTYIGAGTLLIDVMVQPAPLVSPGQGVVAVEIRPTRVPRDLRERSQVELVVVPASPDAEPFVTLGRVVGRTEAADSGDVVSLSVEVSEGDAPRVAAADDVRVVLLDPGIDPATELVTIGRSVTSSAPAVTTGAPTGSTDG